MYEEQKDKSLLFRQLTGLAVVLLLTGLFAVAMHYVSRRSERYIAQSAVIYDTLTVDSLLNSLSPRYLQPNSSFSRPSVPARHLVPFDPNTADSLTLLGLGFAPWQARALMRYRNAGAVFRKPVDFRRFNAIPDSMHAALLPYITIDTAVLPHDSSQLADMRHSVKKDTVLELNSCDTAELRLLRGIGSFTAGSIVRYRRELGGYVNVNQLKEIENIKADSLLCFFVVDTSLVQPIKVNSASVERLARHPYISFSQAKDIYTLRREMLRLESSDILIEKGILTENQRERLQHYLDFE